jgi:hypothetical protein
MVSFSANIVCAIAEGVEDSEGLLVGDAPAGRLEPEGVRVLVGDAGLEGDSEGYADSVDVAEALAPVVLLDVGEREGVRVPVLVGVSVGVWDSEGVVLGVIDGVTPSGRGGVSVGGEAEG